MPRLLAAALLLALPFPLLSAPFTPRADTEVVEHLPGGAADPAARRVDALRKQLAARPDDANLRLEVAQRYFDLAMAQGDPRYVGYASAAIGPLEKASAGRADYWLVRGLIEQYSHDFPAALRSLQRASEIDPKAPEPVAWRAAIRMVQAQYKDAAAECERLAALAPGLIGEGCTAYLRATTGRLADAYASLSRQLAQAGPVDPGIAMWTRTRLAEMAIRLQRPDEAEQHFRAALATGVTDQFLLGAYADFLLQQRRPQEAMKLLADWERSDILLLRLALAGKAAGDPRAKGWADQLRDRFADAARRGDRLHEQEASRFALEVEGDTAKALQLASDNYTQQKEPRDAEMLLRAAIAARQPAAARPVLEWLAASRYEDPAIASLAAQVQGGQR
jgi:Tfp pilus assembly protein PilF